jgi:DNA-binding CsgD family transcriptional regulator
VTEDPTRRQLEIACCLANGMTNAEVAAHLYLEIATVRNHIAMGKRRTGAKTTIQLVALCVHEGALVLEGRRFVVRAS